MAAIWYKRFAMAAASLLLLASAAWAADEPPLIKRLDGGTRARVLAALAGLIILGFAMVLLAWLGARMTQRYRQGSAAFRPTKRPGEHDWAKTPLVPGEPEPPTADP